ncbi:MAG: HAD family phosphatase [Sphingobacteriia bacterium]|nr:HAD family phosphatase [Sphingobacteriia bacterium]
MKQTIDQLVSKWNIKAVIFDLDGTMIDNNAYHLAAWRQYLTDLGINITEEEYRKNINGRTNKDAIEYIYRRTMTKEEAMVYALEKEAVYRRIYQPFIQPVEGLTGLLKLLEEKNIPMGIATSGIQVNINFMFEHIPVRKFFSAVINSEHITHGKPHPEIFLKTAEALHVSPGSCLVFEDAAVGVEAAKAAGMNVVALTTTQTEAELAEADLIIKDFSDLIHL